jgi:hypothetical protein
VARIYYYYYYYYYYYLIKLQMVFIWWQWYYSYIKIQHTKIHIKNSMVLVRERTIPTERPPVVGEVIANFCG